MIGTRPGGSGVGGGVPPDVLEEPMLSPRLTGQQRTVLARIASHVDDHGFPPSLRELGAALGLWSSHTIHQHVHALVRKGCLTYQRGSMRTLQVTVTGRLALRTLRGS